MYISQQLSCTGKVEVDGATARLDDVAVITNGKKVAPTYRVCLAKGARWFLVHIDEGREDCLDEAPKADTEIEEQLARDDYAQLLDAQRVHSADKRLAAVKAAVERAPTTEKACSETAITAASTKKEKTKAPLVIRAIGLRFLDGKDDPDFAFLSDAELARYVAGKKKAVVARADDARLVLGEGLLVVYKHKTREMPEVTDKGAKATGWTVSARQLRRRALRRRRRPRRGALPRAARVRDPGEAHVLGFARVRRRPKSRAARGPTSNSVSTTPRPIA